VSTFSRISLMSRFAVVVVATCSFSAATAQNETRDARTDQPPQKIQARDLRAELAHQIESLAQRQRLLERAIKQLDEGADASEIQSRLREAGFDRPMRGGMRGGRDNMLDAPMRGDDARRGQPRGGEQMRMRGHTMPDLTDEDKANIIAFIKKQSPSLWERINSEPASIDRFVRRFGPRYFAYVDAARRDKPLGELTLREFEAGFEVMRAIGDLYRINAEPKPNEERVRERIGAVREAITKQFDVKLQIQRRELALLKARVQKLEAEVDTTETNRSQKLSAHLERVVNDIKRRAQNARNRHRDGQPNDRRFDDRKPGEHSDGDKPTRRRGG
jgi:DNA repair exonuclease SbcCD ATPase subunit